MPYNIMFNANDGLWRRAPGPQHETAREAEAALTAAKLLAEAPEQSDEPLAQLIADDRVKRLWIQEELDVFSNRSTEVNALTRRPAIEQSVEFFRELDRHHYFPGDRLNMTRWGQEGIAEFVRLFDITRDYWKDHECHEVEEMDAYDPEAGGFIIFDHPGRVIDPESPEGEEYIRRYKIECTEEIAYCDFVEAVKNFEMESGDAWSTNTSGCVSYWVSLWFSSQETLERLATANWADLRDNAGSILGLTPRQMEVLARPDAHPEVYAHATPIHVASVLERYVYTGVLTWKDTVPERCEELDCESCG